MRRGRPEASEQEVVVAWLRFRRLLFCHVPNGGLRGGRQGKLAGVMLKRMGVSAGVPDLLIFTRPPAHPDRCGFALEMKAPDGPAKASGRQALWLDALAEVGWLTAVCRGADVAIRALTQAGY